MLSTYGEAFGDLTLSERVCEDAWETVTIATPVCAHMLRCGSVIDAVTRMWFGSKAAPTFQDSAPRLLSRDTHALVERKRVR